MTNESVFSFELNESLYFEKGQEVAEIIGISLDPEISIQSFNDYVSIRGVVELKGEYQKVHSELDDEDSLSYFDDYHSRRYMERVSERDDGIAEFIHRFPVEISVPTYRIKELNDVTVTISSFDYEMPDQSQLRLKSVIEIHGIHNDKMEDPAEPEWKEEAVLEDNREESFAFEIKHPKAEVDEMQEESSSVEPDESSSREPEHLETESSSEKDLEKDRWLYKKTQTQTLKEFFNKDKLTESPSSESSESSSPISEAEWNESSRNQETARSEESSEAVHDLRYLSGMFKDDEERYAKMRLCIVQEKDTIESIAERYDTTTLQILSRNRLTDENLTAGQLLYIPYKKKEK